MSSFEDYDDFDDFDDFDDMSKANGTLSLLGDWTQEAIDGLNAVLKVWAVFQHNPGICAEGNASLEKRTLKFTCQGVWPVSFIPGCFELHLNKPLNLNTLIRDYIKKP